MPALARVLRNEDEDKGSQPSLFNIANRGLSLMTKSGALQTAGDCSINLLGTARSSPHNLKGYVFGLKFYPSRSKEVGVNCKNFCLTWACFLRSFSWIRVAWRTLTDLSGWLMLKAATIVTFNWLDLLCLGSSYPRWSIRFDNGKKMIVFQCWNLRECRKTRWRSSVLSPTQASTRWP